MRSGLVVLLLSLSSLAGAQAPDTVTVALTHEVTSGPFGSTLWGLRPEAEPEALAGVPDSLAELAHYAWALPDTTGADAVASVVIGRDGRRRHVIVADTDNDERLDDEAAVVLDPYWLPVNRERAGQALPTVPVAVEVGPERRAVRGALVIDPYVNTSDGQPWRTADGGTYYFGDVRRHAWGLAPTGDTLFVAPTSYRSVLSSPWGLRVRVGGMAEGEEDYGLGDVVPLGDRAFRVLGVTADGAAVRLAEAPEGVPEVGLRVGQRAPDFRARTEAGDSLHLGDLRGRFVLLDFWGTWCGPCRRQTPTFKDAVAAYDPDRLLLIGIADDHPGPVADYVAEHGLAWPQVVEGRDRPKPVHEAYDVNRWPSTFLIDPDGRIVAKGLYDGLLGQLAEHVGPPDCPAAVGRAE